MPWLAIIFGPYLNHFKSDFDGVKSRVGHWFTQLKTFNQLPKPIYQTNLRNQICSLVAEPNKPNQIYWPKFTKPKKQNWIYKIKSTNQNVLNIKNQIYQTKSIQSNLQNLIHPTNSTKSNLEERDLQKIK